MGTTNKTNTLIKTVCFLVFISIIQGCGFAESDCIQEELDIIENFKIVSDECAGTIHDLVIKSSDDSYQIIESNSVEVYNNSSVIFLKYFKYDSTYGYVKVIQAEGTNKQGLYKRTDLNVNQFNSEIGNCNCKKTLIKK